MVKETVNKGRQMKRGILKAYNSNLAESARAYGDPTSRMKKVQEASEETLSREGGGREGRQ